MLLGCIVTTHKTINKNNLLKMQPQNINTPSNVNGNSTAAVGNDFSQAVDRLKGANNILVTISNNPTVDQLAACIGATLVLNKLNKHANAVFSGDVPKTIDFLQPEKTLEKNTDSLRDFIIALDKSKADKLRYKVENDVVKIFITPYRTSISEKDLEYSQGDFNVDAILAIGVHDKSHLDAAILAHGRILHDATVISLNTTNGSKLGSINWVEQKASSFCEMVADVARELSRSVFDSQNATALLTGIVAETDRYSNEKVSPHTMSIAGLLMASGASSQLVSSKLEVHEEIVENAPMPIPKHQDQVQQEPPKEEENDEDKGVIQIPHEKPEEEPKPEIPALEPLSDEEQFDIMNQIEIDEQGRLKKLAEEQEKAEAEKAKKEDEERRRKETEQAPPAPSRIISEPPQMGGQLTANTNPEDKNYRTNPDPLSTSNLPKGSVLTRGNSSTVVGPARAAGDSAISTKDEDTLSDIEKAVGRKISEDPVAVPSIENARQDLEKAAAEAEADRPQARQDLGSQPISDQAKPTGDKSDSLPSTQPPPVPPPFVPET